MICTTVRNGSDCPMMTKAGCSYEGGVCKPIIEKCEGCARTGEFASEKYCMSAPDPDARWKTGNCNLATHVTNVVLEKKQKVNPIKASKRGGR